MATLRIEGEAGQPARDLSRERFDLQRRTVPEPKAVCHAPFASLHLGRSLAPCRYSRLELGDPRKVSLAEGFGSEPLERLRDRFLHYVVRRDECARCVHHWEDDAAEESPALAEYDRALPPLNGAAAHLAALSIDARCALPAARVKEAIALLPKLRRLTILADSLEPAGTARRLLTAADSLRGEERPAVVLVAHDFVPAPAALPPSVTSVELALPLERGGLDPDTRKRLATLAAELDDRKTPLVVQTVVGRSSWIELKRWLADVLACGATPHVEAAARGTDDSLAALDPDLLALLHGVLYRWSVELAIAGDDRRGAASFSRLLARLRRWQKDGSAAPSAAPSPALSVPLALPELDHELLRDETETRALLRDALRVYHDPRIESWLTRLVQHPELRRTVPERLSLRLVALWLAAVFERHDVRPALRAIYGDPLAAAARIRADRRELAGDALASWHDGWIRALELEKQPRGGPPFQVPAPPRVPPRGPPQVTVVIPSYNHEKFVGAAIDSVLAQAGARLRVLVVDDGSTDGTVAAARTRKDARLTVRRNARNLGLGESFFRALKRVRTPYVAMLNSDDVFHPRRLERLLAQLERSPKTAVAASRLVPVDAEGRACTIADSSPIFDGKRVHDWLQWFEGSCALPPAKSELLGPLLERNCLVTSSNLVARRDFLLAQARRWRDLEYCVDWQIFLAAAAQGALKVIDEPLLAYRLHASNTVWFDEEREWRYYVESHRVVARALDLVLARAGGPAERRFAEQLELIADHLAASDGIDWAGVYLGALLERLGVPSRAIRNDANRRWIQQLDALRRTRVQLRDAAKLLGTDLAELLRVRGELPFLHAARNQAEAIGDELERMRWQLDSAQHDRRNLEKLWHQAERERDQEIAGKTQLWEQVGALEGGKQQAERERDAARAELAKARQRLDAALGAKRAGDDRSRAGIVDAFESVLTGHEHVRSELTTALQKFEEERARIEGGLADTLEGVSKERDRLREISLREREALRLALDRLHEEAATLQEDFDRVRAELDATRARAPAELEAVRAEGLRRLEEERARLIALYDRERAELSALLEREKKEREKLAAALESARDEASKLADARAAERARAADELARERDAHARALAAEAAARVELVDEATAQRDALAAERDALLAQREAAARQRAGLEAAARQLEQETAQLKSLVSQRTWERDQVGRTGEYRLGHLVLNKLKLKRPLRALEKGLHRTRAALAVARLAAERRRPGAGGKPRVFATVCWNFPIWSQTFVYQELVQLEQRGFDVRLMYSKLDPRDHLHQQFEKLWKLKRPMHLDRAIHRADFERMKARFPERAEKLITRLCAASGMSREALLAHDNFLQGFTYARLAQAWGADYLHSYFFYDRSLMSLIAGEVLGLPHGVSCYADHLLNDYELKVVPLHMETCDVVIATSARIKRELLQVAPGTDPDKVLVKPNAIDCTRFPVLPRPEPHPGQPFRLVVTSRIEPKKGLIHLVEAMKLLRDAGLDVEAHLVGDCDKGVPSSENCKAELCDRIGRLDLWGKVHLEGRQPEQGVRRFLAQSHLFVAPFVETHYGDKDGIPTALVEAMATGIPSVVTDAGSILEVVDDRVDARVVPQRDPKALAVAIRELLLDPQGRKFMGRKAAQKAREKFDVSVCEPWFHDRIRARLAARRQ